MKKTPQDLIGPFNFEGSEVYFDPSKSEFWAPQQKAYLDHEIGLALIELYFGHHKAPLKVTKLKKKTA